MNVKNGFGSLNISYFFIVIFLLIGFHGLSTPVLVFFFLD